MRWHWVVVTTLTVAGSAQTVPLRLFGTVITVEGRVNGKGPFYFVVDTGAESCSLLPRVWEEAGVRAGYRVELVSSAGGSELVAASRNLRRVSPQHLGELIETIFRDRIADGQLDEAPLTFEEIAKIKSSFTFTLLNMLHSRVTNPPGDSPALQSHA